ncbi:PREDICTED: GDSL esterase/lipase At1g23500-like [Lupinus angustifolius]|uniref:GDSL esterase/lipase At1g23500-like n=1 Tax=Lupinus angustifolius TaxID=3871 RepID=UPI00092E2E30|nr:PREDICTED: GDSL esterase/lipase At1g23500-like [Lupinus angustifolius]
MDHLHVERLVMAIWVLCVYTIPLVTTANAAYSALFAFGDSILDTGNNNVLVSITKCNHPPYGRDFNGGTPTGRFSNGKVPSDLIAGALKIKDTLPAYNNPNFDPQELPTGEVVSIADQLKMFKEYIGKLTGSVGQQKASEIISNSLVILSAGNNDIAITFSQGRRPMLFSAYSNLLIDWTSSFLKELYALGVRHVWAFSTLTLGCLPGGRASVGGVLCNEAVNEFAVEFNGMLEKYITSIKTTTPDYDVQYVDVYNPLRDIISSSPGFTNTINGCCGGEAVAAGELCTLLTSQCENSSTYVFWDFAHPTQRAYEIIVSDIIQKHAQQ